MPAREEPSGPQRGGGGIEPWAKYGPLRTGDRKELRPAARRRSLLRADARRSPPPRGGCGLPTSLTSSSTHATYEFELGSKPAESTHVCQNCGPPHAEASARRWLCHRIDRFDPQPSGGAYDVKEQPSARGAAAGCRPRMRSNRQVRRRRQEAVRAARREIAVRRMGRRRTARTCVRPSGSSLRRDATERDASCGPSPPKAAARRAKARFGCPRRIEPFGMPRHLRSPLRRNRFAPLKNGCRRNRQFGRGGSRFASPFTYRRKMPV